MNWIEQRIKAEKRKHEKWAGDEWIKIASIKIKEEFQYLLDKQKEETLNLITKEIAIANREGDKTSRLTSLYNKII